MTSFIQDPDDLLNIRNNTINLSITNNTTDHRTDNSNIPDNSNISNVSIKTNSLLLGNILNQQDLKKSNNNTNSISNQTFQQKIISLNQQEDWKYSCTERLRYIDNIYKHSPIPSECDLLNIPKDRLHLNVFKDILLLAGGCASITFDSDEFHQLQEFSKNCSNIYKQLDIIYSSLSNSDKKLKLEAINRSINNEENINTIIKFHCLADDFYNIIMQLVVIINKKQQMIDKTLLKEKFHIDPENLIGVSKPKWLEIWINKFQLAYEDIPISKGKFAVFIANSLCGNIDYNSDELDALMEVSLYDLY